MMLRNVSLTLVIKISMANIKNIMSVASPALGAATSIAGSIIGANAQKKAQARQNAWQSNENQKTRDFNAAESQKARDYQSQMYYQDRAYNSAKNQSRLYSEAGLNPSLMMSQGAGSMSGQSISAPSASSSAGSAPGMDNSGSILSSGLSSAGSAVLQAKQLRIQEELAASQNRLNNANAAGKENQNDIDTALKSKTIARNGIKLQFDIDMDKTNRDIVAAELDEINQRIDESKSRENLFAQEAALTTHQWQSQQYENLIRYSPLGYQMDGVDTDTMEYDLARFVGGCLLLNDASQLYETDSRIRRNLSAAEESWTNVKIGNYTVKQLKSDFDRGVVTLKTDVAEYTLRNILGQLKVDVKVNEDPSVQSQKESTQRNNIAAGKYSSDVNKYAQPVTTALGPVRDIVDLFYDVGTKGVDAFSSMFGSSKETGESVTTREVMDKNGNVHELTSRTSSSKSKTSTSRSRSRSRHR